MVVIVLILVLSVSLKAQKKVPAPISTEELAKQKTFRSWNEAMANKKRVYILNLDGKKISQIPSDIIKLKKLIYQFISFNIVSFHF